MDEKGVGPLGREGRRKHAKISTAAASGTSMAPQQHLRPDRLRKSPAPDVSASSMLSIRYPGPEIGLVETI